MKATQILHNMELYRLWKQRDIKEGSARALASPVAKERQRLWICGSVVFLCERSDSLSFNASFLLSRHCSLMKDHRRLFADEKGMDGKLYLGLVLKTVDSCEITFCPSSQEKWTNWIEKMKNVGVVVSDLLEEEVKRNKPQTDVSSPKEILKRFRQLERARERPREKVSPFHGLGHPVPDISLTSNKSAALTPCHTPSAKAMESEGMNAKHIRSLWINAYRSVQKSSMIARVQKRSKAIRDLYLSERAYVRSLYSLVYNYKHSLNLAVSSGLVSLTMEDMEALFLNCETLLVVHQSFVLLLSQACSQTVPLVGNVFRSMIPLLECYGDFLTLKRRHAKQDSPLDACLNNESFVEFLSEWHKGHDSRGRQLKKLLMKPQERLYEYLEKLETIVNFTDEVHKDHCPLQSCVSDLRSLIAQLNNQPSPLEKRQKISMIIKAIGPPAALLLTGPSNIIKEETSGLVKVPLTSSLKSTIKYKTVRLHLFDTALVVIGKDKHHQNLFPLYGASLYEYVSIDGRVYGGLMAECSHLSLKLYSPGGPRSGVVLHFKNADIRTTWVLTLRKAILDAQPKSVPHSKDNPASNSRLRRSLSTYSINSVISSGLAYRASSPTSTPQMNRKLDRTNSIVSIGSLTSVVSSPPSSLTLSTTSLPRKGYSISELFNFLTDPPTTDYVRTFLITYHLFTNGNEVMDALIESHRFWLNNRQGSEGRTPVAQRLRCLNAFKIWVNKFYSDFRHDSSLRTKLLAYMKEIAQSTNTFDGEREQFKRIIETIEKSETAFTIRRNKMNVPLFLSGDTQTLRFVEISAERISEQLTLLEHETFGNIKSFELVGQKWSKRSKRELAPGICTFIERFNLATRWVVQEVLNPRQPRQRAIMIEKFIRIAFNCQQMNNFNAVFEITLALLSSPIRRLHNTWQEVTSEAMQLLSSFKVLINPKNSFGALREQLKKCSTPAVPYIGAFLSQLVSLEEGMVTFMEDQPDNVNFTKLIKMADAIEEFTRLQMPPYTLEPDKSVLEYLAEAFENAEEFGEDEQDALSTDREPRSDSSHSSTPVGHRVISTVSVESSHSSSSLSHNSIEDYSGLGSSNSSASSPTGSGLYKRESGISSAGSDVTQV